MAIAAAGTATSSVAGATAVVGAAATAATATATVSTTATVVSNLTPCMHCIPQVIMPLKFDVVLFLIA